MDDSLPFAMVELHFGSFHAALTVMRRGKRYHICITTENLRGPQGDALVRTFLDFKESMNGDPQAMEALQEWMVKSCIAYMGHSASSEPRVEPPLLAEYFIPETTIFKLTNIEGQLKATKFSYRLFGDSFFYTKSDDVRSDGITSYLARRTLHLSFTIKSCSGT